MYKINQFSLPLDFDKNNLKYYLSKKLKLKDIRDIKLSKLSLDAREKSNLKYVANIIFDTSENLNIKRFKNLDIYSPKQKSQKIWKGEKKNIIIVGSGPSGLFAGLTLANSGQNVIILERGYEMTKRKLAVDNLMNNGILDEVSNIQFGEGGAGTFSDGKLNTGIKSEHIESVLETFVKFGANESILYDSRPHVGTDILSEVIVNIRKHLESLGSKILFEHKFKELILENDCIKAVKVDTPAGEKILPCDELIMAIGHSSRDTIRTLYSQGLELKSKPFSMGFRIEHLQRDINISQYGENADMRYLPPADYHLAEHLDNGRVIYTFCMCPGGVVVPAMSEENTIVTNGMSYHARDGENSNSALLINVNPEDFESTHPLSGIELQEKYERYAYQKAGGYSATVQRVGDFLESKPTIKLGRVKPSFKPNFTLGSVEDMLPKFVIDSLKLGLPVLNKRLKNFADPDAILTGVETRSSAPYQVIRGQDMESNIKGLYMIGEGAGFAGGIVSSAVEGIKIANILIDKN